MNQYFPVKYIPEWFPGANFKKIARSYKETLRQSIERPFAFTKMQIASGNGRPSLVATLLEDLGVNHSPEEERIVKWTAATFYAAGSDTVTPISILDCEFLLLIHCSLFPLSWFFTLRWRCSQRSKGKHRRR